MSTDNDHPPPTQPAPLTTEQIIEAKLKQKEADREALQKENRVRENQVHEDTTSLFNNLANYMTSEMKGI